MRTAAVGRPTPGSFVRPSRGIWTSSTPFSTTPPSAPPESVQARFGAALVVGAVMVGTAVGLASALPASAASSQLFADTFDTGSTANWTTNDPQVYVGTFNGGCGTGKVLGINGYADNFDHVETQGPKKSV